MERLRVYLIAAVKNKTGKEEKHEEKRQR